MLEPILGYRLLRFCQALAKGLAASYIIIYQIEEGGFGPFQLAALGATFHAAVLLFEVPTGALADSRSRKGSIALGLSVIGACFLAMGSTTDYLAFLVISFLWGIGETFISGAREAWVTEEIPFSRQPDLKPGSLYILGSQAEFLGGIIGIALSGALVLMGLSLPLLAAGLTYWVTMALALSLPEQGFAPSGHWRENLRYAVAKFEGCWRRVVSGGVILLILAVTLFQGMSSEGFDRLWQAFVKAVLGGVPSVIGLPDKTWWAVVSALSLAIAWAVVSLVRRMVDMSNEGQIIRVLCWMTLGILAGILAFAVAPSFWIAVPALVLCRTLRKANSPLMTAWLNLQAAQESRATMLSFEGQTQALGRMLGGPTAGAAAEAVKSLRVALGLTAVFLMPALWAVFSAIRKRGRV